MNGVRKPSEWRILVLSGKISLEDAPEPIQSMLQLDIYKGAVQILGAETKEKRNAMLEKIPERIRGHVKDKAVQVWRGRQ